MTEQHIKVAAKMLGMRDTCRRFFKDQWPEKQAEWKPIIQAVMKKHNCDEINAAMILSKELDGMSIIIVFGTVMEMK
jgi:hypothetical protein